MRRPGKRFGLETNRTLKWNPWDDPAYAIFEGCSRFFKRDYKPKWRPTDPEPKPKNPRRNQRDWSRKPKWNDNWCRLMPIRGPSGHDTIWKRHGHKHTDWERHRHKGWEEQGNFAVTGKRPRKPQFCLKHIFDV
jgi:hypothetical protein